MLFPTHRSGGGVDAQAERQSDVASDERFLINMELENAAAPITLLMNWTFATHTRSAPQRYSQRSATTGSTRMARRAGR
jgi:hypothetical protein